MKGSWIWLFNADYEWNGLLKSLKVYLYKYLVAPALLKQTICNIITRVQSKVWKSQAIIVQLGYDAQGSRLSLSREITYQDIRVVAMDGRLDCILHQLLTNAIFLFVKSNSKKTQVIVLWPVSIKEHLEWLEWPWLLCNFLLIYDQAFVNV